MPDLSRDLAQTYSADPQTATNAAAIGVLQARLDNRDQKDSVRLVSLTNLPLSGLAAVDGVTPVAGDRIGALGQTLGQANGIYVAAAGAWSRAADADVSAEVTSGMYFFATEGTANGDKAYQLTTDDPIVLGTTPLVFQQFAAALKASQVVNDSTVVGADGTALATIKAVLERLNKSKFDPAVSLPVYAMPFSNSVSVSTLSAQYISVGSAPTAVTIGSAGQPVGSHLRSTAATAGSISFATDGAVACLPHNVSWRGSQTCRLGVSSASWRWYNAFHGLYNPTNVDISTLLNCVGIGKADGLANVQLFYNDGAGAATMVDLGASFPASTAGATYRLAVEFDASTGTWYWMVTRLDVAAVAAGSFTADKPATPLQFACGCGNNTDATIVQLFWMGMRAAVDY